MEKEYEKIKYESNQFEKEQNQEILQLNNDIKELTKKLEVQKGDTIRYYLALIFNKKHAIFD